MTKKQKGTMVRIGLGVLLFIGGYWIPAVSDNGFLYGQALCFFLAYIIVGGDVLFLAAKNIIGGRVFDENFLMGIATLGAFGVGEYPEGVAVMLFYQIGELFQGYAVNRSRKSISALMDIRPDYANIERDGVLLQVDPEEVEIGRCILVKPGERIPLDGRVSKGNSLVDTSALTGESVPRSLGPGSEALSGCVNLNGTLTIVVEKEFGQSTVSKILELVENAGSKKAKAENFITKFAKYYTPVVVLAAVVLALIPPLVIPGALFSEWIHRALIFLVISCPCALVISIPLSFFGGIGGASKCGILVKGSNYLEALAAAEIVVFDKTGTLTKGTFSVIKVEPTEGEAEDKKLRLLEIAALAENYSDHPIAVSLKKAYGKEIDGTRISQVTEVAGCGVKALVDGMQVYVGNSKLMKLVRLDIPESLTPGTYVYVASESVFLGTIIISDEIKENAAAAVSGLMKAGVKKTVMLTGDLKATGEHVAALVGVDQVYAELLPADKVTRMEALLKEKSKKGKLVFVGDGINDAPVLAQADIGIAMGGLGADAAIEAADLVIMDDEPAKLVTAIHIARKTLTIVKQNIVFALSVKALVLLMGALGAATMWEAVFADVGVSVIAILNAMRALDVSKYREKKEV